MYALFRLGQGSRNLFEQRPLAKLGNRCRERKLLEQRLLPDRKTHLLEQRLREVLRAWSLSDPDIARIGVSFYARVSSARHQHADEAREVWRRIFMDLEVNLSQGY